MCLEVVPGLKKRSVHDSVKQPLLVTKKEEGSAGLGGETGRVGMGWETGMGGLGGKDLEGRTKIKRQGVEG